MIKKFFQYSNKVLDQVSRVASITGIIFLLAIVVLTTADVFLRYVLNKPILGSVELTQYFIIVAGFLGLAWCAVRGGI